MFDLLEYLKLLAFGGFAISAFLFFFALIQKLLLHHSWPLLWSFIIVYGLMHSLLIITVLLDTILDFFSNLDIRSDYLGDRFLEWLYFFTILIWYFGMGLIAKNNLTAQIS